MTTLNILVDFFILGVYIYVTSVWKKEKLKDPEKSTVSLLFCILGFVLSGLYFYRDLVSTGLVIDTFIAVTLVTQAILIWKMTHNHRWIIGLIISITVIAYAADVFSYLEK